MASVQPDEPKTRVFLSYSRKDAAFAVWLRERLEKDGIEVYRDVDDTLPSEQWWARLQQLIGDADTILFVLSGHSAASTVCAQEVAHAQSLNKRIFPAVIAEVDWSDVPAGLAKVHGIHFRADGTQEAAVQQLISALLVDIGWVREHTRLLQRAQRWDGRGRARTELLSGRSLREAEAWLAAQPGSAEAPTNLHRAYIQAGRQRATQQQRNRFLGLAVGILAAAAAAGLVLWNQQIAKQQSLQAQTLKSLRIVDQAQRLTRQGETTTALLLGLEVLPNGADGVTSPFEPAVRRSLFAAAAQHRLRTIMRPDGPAASDAKLHPDGTRLFLRYQRRATGPVRTRMLEVKAGRISKSVMPQDLRGQLRDVVFSPDGQRSIVVLKDGRVQLRNGDLRQTIADLAHVAKFGSEHVPGAFSIDGTCLVTRGTAIQIHDPRTGAQRAILPAKYERWRLSGKGCRVAGKTRDHNTITVWDGIKNRELAVFAVDTQVSFSLNASGTLLATTDYGGVTLWDVGTGKRARSFRAHQRRTYSVAFSTVNDELMVTEGDDGISLWIDWDHSANTSIGRINGTDAVFTDDGKLIVADAESSRLEVWEFPFVYKYGHEPRRIAVLPGTSKDPIVAKHGLHKLKALLALYKGGEVRLWSLARPLQRAHFKNMGMVAAVSRDRSRLITVDRGAELPHHAVIWDANRLKRLHRFELDNATAEALSNFETRALQLGPAGKSYLTLAGERDKRTLSVFDANSGTLAFRIAGSLHDVVAARFTADGRRVVTAAKAGAIVVWNARTGSKTKTIASGAKNIIEAIATDDTRHVVLATREGAMLVVDLETGQVARGLRSWPGLADERGSEISLAENSGTLAVASGKHFRAFDLSTGKLIVSLASGRYIHNRVAVGFGKIALMTSDDGYEARIFDIAAKDWVGRLPVSPRGAFGQSEFLAGGTQLLTEWWPAFRTGAQVAIWRLQPTARAAASFARSVVPKCLTQAEREQYQLPKSVPDWCIAMRKPPYDSTEWRQRLAVRPNRGAVSGGSHKQQPTSVIANRSQTARQQTMRRPPMPAGRTPPDWQRR